MQPGQSLLRLMWRIARHQLSSLLRQKVAITVIALVSFTGLGALAVDWRNHVEHGRLRHEAEQHQRELWEHLDVSSAHAAAHVGTLIFRPEPPAAMVDSGLLPFVGSAMILRAHERGELSASPVQDAPFVPHEGFMALAAVLQVLLPLVLAVCVAPVLAEERESGLARFIVAQGVPRPVWIAGSIGGRAVPAYTLLAFFLAASSLCLSFTAETGTALGVTAFRLLLLLFWHALVLLVFTALFGAISLRARSSRASLTASLCLCAWCCVIGPRMVQSASSHIAPLPTRAELDARTHRDMAPLEDDNYFQRHKQIVAELLAKYHSKSEKDLPVNAGGYLLQEYEALGAHVAGLRSAEVYVSLQRQLQWSEWLGLFDIRSAVEAGSMRLAGTGPEDLQRFDEQAEAYRFSMVQHLNEDQKRNIPGADYHELRKSFQKRREALLHGIGPFQHQELPLGQATRSLWRCVVVLYLWLTTSAAALVLATLRTRKAGL